MHVPDGFLDVPVSAGAGVVAAAAVAVSLRGSRRELAGGTGPAAGGRERTAPLAGLVAAFIFAVQMLNFPVGAGTSGHLMGGALAAILVGPHTAVLCLSVVLLLQAVLFADGGLTALGVNIVLIGVVTVLTAHLVFRGLVRLLPDGRRTVTVATFVAALVSVPVAAAVFTGMYALGGTARVDIGTVLTAMVGVHVLIGLGEAAITALTVSSVLAVRPDLVYGARHLLPTPVLRTAPTGTPRRPAPTDATATTDTTATTATTDPTDAARPEPTAPAARPRPVRRLWLAGLVVTVLLAGVVSFYASSAPDGLEKVAGDHGISEQEEEHRLGDSPLADYGVRDIANERLSGGLAGVIGVGATLVVGSAVVLLTVRARRTTPSPAAGAPTDTPAVASREPATSTTEPTTTTGTPHTDTPGETR